MGKRATCENRGKVKEAQKVWATLSLFPLDKSRPFPRRFMSFFHDMAGDEKQERLISVRHAHPRIFHPALFGFPWNARKSGERTRDGESD